MKRRRKRRKAERGATPGGGLAMNARAVTGDDGHVAKRMQSAAASTLASIALILIGICLAMNPETKRPPSFRWARFCVRRTDQRIFAPRRKAGEDFTNLVLLAPSA